MSFYKIIKNLIIDNTSHAVTNSAALFLNKKCTKCKEVTLLSYGFFYTTRQTTLWAP